MEDLIHANTYHRLLPEKSKKHSFSVGCDFGRLIFGNQKRYEVKYETDIESAADLIMDDFRTVGEPYLKKYSDLSVVFETLLERARGAELLDPFPSSRAMKLIGTGLLLEKEKAYLRELAEEVKNDLPERDVEDFEVFVNKVL